MNEFRMSVHGENFTTPFDVLLNYHLEPDAKRTVLKKWTRERLRYLYTYFHERCWERDKVIDDLNLCLDFLAHHEKTAGN